MRQRFDPKPAFALMEREGYSLRDFDAKKALRSSRTLQRWKKAKRITAEQADELANMLSKHPSEIWGREWA